MVFPVTYNSLMKWRSDTRAYLYTLMALLTSNAILLTVTWYTCKDWDGYYHYNPKTGDKNEVDEYNDASEHNGIVLGWYLFAPFWILYFVIGCVTAFLYDAYRPAEKINARIWGYVADVCTLLILGLSMVLVSLPQHISDELFS